MSNETTSTNQLWVRASGIGTDVRPDVDTTVDTTLDPTNPRDCAHIVDQRDPANDVTSAVVEGREVTALCGYRWIPYRDAKGRPVCEACVEAYGRITGS